MNDWLLIPCVGNVHELLFQLAHDCLGHFGFEKSYLALCNKYYWPNMQQDLEFGYVKGCDDCACNKDRTTKILGLCIPC